MKEHNIDQLFRQKLHQHGETPSPAAWEQLAKGMQRKRRKKGGYYAAAAAIALFLLAGWFGLQLQQNSLPLDTSGTLVVNEPLKRQEQPKVAGPETIQKEAKPADASSETAAASEAQVSAPGSNATQMVASADKKQAQQARRSARPIKAVQEHTTEPTPSVALQVPQELQAQPAIAKVLPAPNTREAALELSEEALKTSVTPVALASNEQVVIRYEANNQADEETEDSENAPEKVLSLLQKVKQGEVSLGSIRQAKNNLLSGKFNKP